jgi:hypothetical protein
VPGVIEKVQWREEPIARRHDRKGFDCGSQELNTYLERYARQNHESGGAKTFVAVLPAEPAHILGYYSISPGSIEFARVPSAARQPSTLPQKCPAALAAGRPTVGQ